MLHPQVRALLRVIEERGLPDIHTLSPVDARRVYRDRRFFTQPDPPEVGLVRDLQADGRHGPIPLRLYRPLGTSPQQVLPVLVFFHGGGFVIGDLDTHDVLCRTLANQAGCAVVAVDYRLAPEHPFPAAVDDSLAATRWVHRHAAELALDPARRTWVHLARGSLVVNGHALQAGDGMGLLGEAQLSLSGGQGAEVLVFDLAA